VRKATLSRLGVVGFLCAMILGWQPAAARAETRDFKADFLRLCDDGAKAVEEQTVLIPPAKPPIRGFFQDSYAVRALAVAYDATGKAEYLRTCKRWSDRMIEFQNGMIPKGAYYMNIDRAPGQDKGDWNVADCASIATGILATAVRCDDLKEKARYMESVKAFAKLVADNWVRPSGGVTNGLWSKSDDEFWCATGLYGSLAFCLYKETGDLKWLKIGQGTIDWLNRQDLLTVAGKFYHPKYIPPTVMMYCLEAYSAGLPHLDKGTERHKAAMAQLAKAHDWILKNTDLPSDDKYLSHWGSKRGGLPFHLYIYARQVPGSDHLTAKADRELARIGDVLRKNAATNPFADQLAVFALMSYAEKVSPGGIFRTSRRVAGSDAERAARAGVLRGTLGTFGGEPRGKDGYTSIPDLLLQWKAGTAKPVGRVDVRQLLADVLDLHANTYHWHIWRSPTDWDDLQRFLPLAREKGISVWVSVMPPSECPPKFPNYSEPFRLDYDRWAVEIAKLSVREPNLVAWSIDDFVWDVKKTFTPERLGRMIDASHAINPKLAFCPCVYWPAVVDPKLRFVERYGPMLDGILFPYRHDSGGANLKDPGLVEAEIKHLRKLFGPSMPIILDVYATAHSSLGATTPAYVREVMTAGNKCADGIHVYCHQSPEASPEKYGIIKELFHRWSAKAR
jgi:hypothetical protein